jgi:hypothetical protein
VGSFLFIHFLFVHVQIAKVDGAMAIVVL